MNIFFSIGERAGMIGLLAALADGHTASGVVSYGDIGAEIAKLLYFPVYRSLGEAEEKMSGDLLLSVHGREIVPRETLRRFRYGGINVHPCYYDFPGANPIRRWSHAHRNKTERELEVVAHTMTAKIDRGIPLAREYCVLDPGESEEKIYNSLYPVYAKVVIRALRKVNP